ncbi:hypothetical protein [Lactobacillus amylolyticus]|uniref:hypothetical protein n=1 Tax=Lactobacillus amylolyticus TaxID=83683 RepID=UPI0024919868|nr:hypothetical protein [Lactobacillus amylolyticus]
MKKFEDYFKDALAYGESLGLKQTKRAGAWVELDSVELDSLDRPVIYAMMPGGICVNVFVVEPEQQLKLIKMFTLAYENYLADKKEPVAADSER